MGEDLVSENKLLRGNNMAVGRFQVMALLQAARAFVLGLPLESAQSWGLNRAIFYAAAKKGLLVRKPVRLEALALPTQKLEERRLKEIQNSFGIHHLGDEMAYKVEMEGKTLFVIGNEIQSQDKFKKQVVGRFKEGFEEAWREAVKICKSFDKGVLLSQRYFYETVYKPRRDELAMKWTELSKSEE